MTPLVYEIEMPSGVYIDVSKPDPSADIRLEDIAHKLAQTNRFGGSAKYPYSVAQHSVFVSRRLEALRHGPEACLAGLHHDDGEYVVTDIQKPIKMYIEDMAGVQNPLGVLEDLWHLAIETRFSLPELGLYHNVVKSADVFAVLIEAKNLVPSRGVGWRKRDEQSYWRPEHSDALPKKLENPPYWLGEIHWKSAREDFLERHYALKEKIDGTHS